MHSLEKTIAELHVMLKLYEKGIPKKAETPAVLAIQEGKIQKDKKKPRGAKGKDKGKNKLSYAPKPKILPPPKRDNSAKDSICHHCKEVGHWRRNCPSYQAKLEKRKNASVASTLDNVFYFNAIPRDGIYEIDMHNLYSNVSSMFNVINKRAKHALDSSYLWHCRLGHINKKHMDKLQRNRILQPTHDELLEKCKSCISGKLARKPFLHQVERAKDLLGLIHTDVCGLLELCQERVLVTPSPLQMISAIMGYALDSASRILNMVLTKKVERTPYEIWHMKAPKLSYLRYLKETMSYYFCYPLENKIFVAQNAKFFENSLMVQEASGSHGLHESIHNEVARIEVEPRNVEIPIRRSARIPQALDRYGFYVDVKEYESGDLNEPPNYKDALSNLEFDNDLKL
ncbi:retrotransposon protein, putative, ty1-copia subclass [Tanacetum coccineum]